MYTYQDFEKETDVAHGVSVAIARHMESPEYKIALDADLYDHQKNKTIYQYVKYVYGISGEAIEDFTSSNNRIASNYFHRLNTQRTNYLLGNGISFSKDDKVKDQLGAKFDRVIKEMAYYGLIHGISFGFWNVKGMHLFKLTEFAPMWDEDTGALRAGVRFWQIDDSKPMIAVLYEEDGFTKYKSRNADGRFEEIQPKRAYRVTTATTPVDGEEVIGENNYGSLPILPLWGSNLKQSTLVGMRGSIDSYDLIRSGFANDLTDCAMIYWIVGNAGGMTDSELAQFRDRIKLHHIAVADTDNSSVTPYTQDIPYEARKTYLDDMRSGIYEDFGGLDVHAVAAGATNDHIAAAYQPMDDEADDFEYQILDFFERLFGLLGLDQDNVPVFKRNKISNEMEQTQMVMMAADYLDDETLLQKLPFVTVDEVADIMKKTLEEKENRYTDEQIDERSEELPPEEENEGVNG